MRTTIVEHERQMHLRNIGLCCVVVSGLLFVHPNANAKDLTVSRKAKEQGQIFTPSYLVKTILDVARYTTNETILCKHVIDNACGDGAFLKEIVCRYIKAYYKTSSDKERLSNELGTYIHGIEIDNAAFKVCIAQLDRIVSDEGIPSVDWDVRNEDTLTVQDYDGRMDYVVGNPPYVRVHNLNDNFSRIKGFSFCSGGMTDLYLLFYELSFKMLSPRGKLCFITANSWFNSLAGATMRAYVLKNRNLRRIIDLGHYQAFNATTYTAIALFENGRRHREIQYSTFGESHKIQNVDMLPYEDAFCNGALYFGPLNAVRDIKLILTNNYCKVVSVKNGFATLADSVFISDEFPFTDFVIPVIKASTGNWRVAFYPYDDNGNPLSYEKVFSNRQVAKYLNAHKDELLKGSDEDTYPGWFLYGRTQALRDVSKVKYAINNVIRDVNSIKLNRVESGCGVYSGLYILTDKSEEELREALLSQDFIDYVVMLKKYKSGGYYTFSSKELAQYLNYKLAK